MGARDFRSEVSVFYFRQRHFSSSLEVLDWGGLGQVFVMVGFFDFLEQKSL